MITSFQALHRWLCENNIEPEKVCVELSADFMTADRIGRALRREANKLSFVNGTEPIREGHICGIKFNINNR